MTTITMSESLNEAGQNAQGHDESWQTMIQQLGERARQIPVRWLASQIREIPVIRSEEECLIHTCEDRQRVN